MAIWMGVNVRQSVLFVTWSLIVLVRTTDIRVTNLESLNERADPVILNHVVLDSDTNDLYIGAVNRIYRLSFDLSVQNVVFTGPNNDSQSCTLAAYSDPTKCSAPRKLMDNYNKVLLLHKVGGQKRILTCGTYFQGICESRNVTLVESKVYPIAVATNDPGANTVSLITRVNSPDVTATQGIFTASDFFNDTTRKMDDPALFIRKDQVEAIAIRNIQSFDDTFKVLLDSGSDKSYLKYHPDYIRPGILKFIAGVTSGDFTYLVITESSKGQNEETIYKTRIAHMCQKDVKFLCFVELPLLCQPNYTIATAARVIRPASSRGLDADDDILVVSYRTNEDRPSSAVCVYNMKYIQGVVLQNIKGCRQGNISFAQKKFRDGSRCDVPVTAVTSNEELLCPKLLAERVSGIIPAENQAAVIFPDTSLTAVALSTTTEFTVAFVGTATGTVKKLVIESNTTAHIYGNAVTVDTGSPIQQDLLLDRGRDYIIAISEKKVARIKIHNCEQYTTCSSCLSSNDPYCGWCTLENKCSLKSLCPNPTVSRWKKYGRGPQDCIVIMDISPPMASVEIPGLILYLTVMDLPNDTNYSCEFNFGSAVPSARTFAQPWSSGLGCAIPDMSQLRALFQGRGDRNVSLGVRASETNQVVVYTSYTFYQCSSFTSCSSCVDNRYWCDWCISENKCTYNPQRASCMGDVIYSRNDTYESNQTEYVYSHGNYGRNGPLHCPHIDLRLTGRVFVPNGRGRAITIRGRNLPLISGNGGYVASVRTSSQGVKVVQGQRVNETDLIFSILPIQEELVNGMYNASMTITWGNNYSLDSQGLYLTLYSCTEMARGDCSFCRNLESSLSQLNCHWCNGDCVYDTTAMCRQEQCPAPRISTISPTSGHYLGGTRVTITGSNLGSSFRDIDHNVSIANIACAPLEELYRPAKQIVCVIGASSGEDQGFITIMRHQITNFTFYYRKPRVLMVEPANKAQSGGGYIMLRGDHLKTGNQISVTINGSLCTDVKRHNETSVSCKVPGSPNTGVAALSVTIDGKDVQTAGVTFTYVSDPTIDLIEPLESFVSGGRQLTVLGTNLYSVDTPKIFAWIDEDGMTTRTRDASCRVFNETTMFCPSPMIQQASQTQSQPSVNLLRLKRAAAMLSAEIGFMMDDVQSVQNLSGAFMLRYFHDPVITKFVEEKGESEIKRKGDVLIISGNGFTNAASRSDVRVNVGNAKCNVTNLAEDKIYCDPPLKRPQDDGSPRSDGMPRVIVYIGNRKWIVGYLQYEQTTTENLMMFILLGVAGSAALVMVIVLIVCVWYRRQRNKAKREMKKIQIQLDNLESNVRNECKQAFAELQTDMTDLTKELDASKKPFYKYDDYTFKVLFPGNVDHVILHPPQQRNGNIDRHPDVAITHFNTLLHNKHFLLMFIRTLERQKNFSIRDKSNVASLLIILFQNNMEYITEILKCLLHDLIEKSIDSKHPKLMLRRTESVVEKLLANWLSLCLYKHLIDSAGSSLYTLYQAIKVQVDKGPVDQLTGDARYSLSEDRLLRTEVKLEPKLLTLNVDYDGRRTKCRVLDCDTISQAKEKMLDTMFRNFPYSQRPCAADLDLEWVQCSKTLSDEDGSTQKVDGWKQLNNLKHYGVIDGADMVLTQHQNCRTLPRSPNGSVHSSGFQFNREAVPITRTESEMGCKYWHLVKQDDNQNTNGGIKLSSEIYLTRLLSTKGTLKKYIDDFFQTLLTASSSMPPVIKYLFDFLDDAAKKHSLTVDPDVVHTWKCNSLLLRFWVNIIKNPDFLYDINKPNIIDSCLSVVAQTFMDSCSTSDHHLNPDSPTNKLLFAKDIPQYKQWVEKYFQDIKALPPVSDQDLNAYLAEVSRMCTGSFTRENALHELYNYVHEYTNEINESLEADTFASAQQLQAKLGHVITTMEGPSTNKKTDYV